MFQHIAKSKKLTFFISVASGLLLLFIALNVYFSYSKIVQTVEVSIANQNINMAQSIVESFDKDTYKRFLEQPERNESYWEIRNYLNDARQKTSALHVYTLEIDNPNVSHAMIVGFPVTDEYEIGMVCTVPKQQVEKAYLEGGTFMTGVIEDPEYGDYLTVGVPIKDNGNTLGYLGIDVDADQLNQIKLDAIKGSALTFVFNILFVIVLLVVFYFLFRWYQKEMKSAVKDTEDTYQHEFQSLLTTVKSIRHDFANHIQVLHGLIHLKHYEKTQEYIKSLKKDIQSVDLSITINNPALLVLLNTKVVKAQNHQIDTKLEITKDPFDHLHSTDLIKILSNLIDNAIDATVELPPEEREIKITGKRVNDHYLFIIENTGPTIKDTEAIFSVGFSTKEKKEGVERGTGLPVVRAIVEKLNGEISCESHNHVTRFHIMIPVKSESK